ncbi:Ig-like domain-containing protein, partial [Mycobacterium sp. 1423905.2]|uniref:Ig-like domain-containing protein n=1 Tax=Mycobacterium sp. 1423905.2 TaxID=1856859 RepID=UPI000ACA887F
MRAVIRCFLTVIAIAATVLSSQGGVSLTAASNPYAFAVASVLPRRGETVGVAHPVIVTFKAPMTDPANRRAAERAIQVTSSPGLTGRFEWLDNHVVQWVPDRFWPAHGTVALSVGTVATDFKTGPAVIGVASISNHTFTVSVDGAPEGPPPSLPAPHHRPHWGEDGVMPASMG